MKSGYVLDEGTEPGEIKFNILITNLVSAMTVADELGALKPYFADGVAETEQEKWMNFMAFFIETFLRIP